MKDILIVCLIGYILYDRYVREQNITLLKSDIDKLTLKAENLMNQLNPEQENNTV
jgi:hypothetical protein